MFNFYHPNAINISERAVLYALIHTKQIMDKETNYTSELYDVLDYMEDILTTEFPTSSLTPQYLVVSLLDTRNCHANLILDNCLMSHNLEELRTIYIEALYKHSSEGNNRRLPTYDGELERLLSCAKKEMVKTNEQQVGTEHVLLAILNRANHFKEADIFASFKLDYNFLLDKCTVSKSNQGDTQKPKKIKSKKVTSNPMSLKSNVNTTVTVNNSMGGGNFINQFTVNISEMADEGLIDDVIGRDGEIKEIIKILSRRKKNNVVIVGNGGVGKTSLVYKLAKMINEGNVPRNLEEKEIVMIDIMKIVSGTHFRGMFEERVNGLFNELQKSDHYILFIDDMHTVLKSGSKDKDTDISGMIGNILSEGKVQVIGTTTFKDYRNSIESNTSIVRKLQKIVLEPTTKVETKEILNSVKKYYEEYHSVRYTDEAIEKAIELADRYVTDRLMPDSAIDIIDLARSINIH